MDKPRRTEPSHTSQSMVRAQTLFVENQGGLSFRPGLYSSSSLYSYYCKMARSDKEVKSYLLSTRNALKVIENVCSLCWSFPSNMRPDSVYYMSYCPIPTVWFNQRRLQLTLDDGEKRAYPAHLASRPTTNRLRIYGEKRGSRVLLLCVVSVVVVLVVMQYSTMINTAGTRSWVPWLSRLT
ncbi:hypothetical protein BKA59DRAFT_488728 [Fusarium tricinctum]|uniref:Uncharacterized protein n=1 Tax=Fusarium tricinctum TaxID=61284 RepID=A0A8K0RKM7_9HYPO|nr:hypothetical protein BKA59DRAFT_488728 [Fusarium tricinctum]